MMINKGDRVRHSNVAESFGVGAVLEINEKANTALVEWDAHEVTRETKKLAKHQTHVNQRWRFDDDDVRAGQRGRPAA